MNQSRQQGPERAKEMCPLRIILIFLSAALASFFVLRNLKSSKPQLDDDEDNVSVNSNSWGSTDPSVARSSKFCAAIKSGFWTCVDMASGRYLWRHLVSSSPEKTN